MKSIKLTLIIALLAGICSQSCRKGSNWGIKGSGEKVTETKVITDFNAIDLSMDATVIYTQDSVYKVEVTAQRNILSVMDLKVEGGELIIDFKRNIMSHDGITFVIHSPNLNKIEVSGSGYFKANNQLSATGLDINISGSGKVYVPTVSLQSLNVDISGSGSLTLDGGTCKNETFDLSGTGYAKTDNVSALTARTKVSGSGSITVDVSDRLYVDISGSGTVSYKGRPIIESDISGSGKIFHLD